MPQEPVRRPVVAEEGAWQGYTPDMTETEARQRFCQKWGREPERVRWAGPCILAGPIRDT